MRLVLDTNTALSALLWGGTPGHLLDAAATGRIELASSTALLAELHGVMKREKFALQLARRGLACAVAASADAIVSGDHDLRILGDYRGIRILVAREALALIAP